MILFFGRSEEISRDNDVTIVWALNRIEEKCDVTLPWQQNFWLTTMENLSNDDGDGDDNGKKAIGLYWQNNHFARESRFFCTFLSRRCKTAT